MNSLFRRLRCARGFAFFCLSLMPLLAQSNELSGALNAVVRIEAVAPDDAPSAAFLGRQREGSGVVLDDRTVLTIGYLIVETDEIMVHTRQGRRVPASVAGYDHQTGFGLVRTVLPLGLAGMALGDSDAISERQRVLTLGHGEAEFTELTVVSRKPFAGSWEYLLENPLFTFPPVNNWSGSALVDESGRLVGIGSLVVNDAALDRRGVPGNLFVPVNLLKPILGDLLASGRRQREAQPWFGMSTESVRGRLIVTRVQQGGPASLAGLGAGDVLVAVNGEAVGDQVDFYRRLYRQGPAGTPVRIRLLQQGQVKELELRSVDRADFLAKPRGI
jgi:serine protease Do